MKTGGVILKNLLSLASAEVVARIVGFLTTIYLGRVLGAEGFGKLGFAQSFNYYFIILAVSGLNVFGIREIAKRQEETRTLTGQIFGLKIITTVLSFFLLIGLIFMMPKPADVKTLMIVLACSVFTNGLTMEWILSGLEKMEWIAIVGLIRNGVYLILVFTLVHGTADIFFVGVAILLPEIVAVVLMLFLSRKHFGSFSISFDTSAWPSILRASIPLAFTSFLLQIYYQIDIVMLGFWTTDTITGWYVSASTIILSLLGLGSLLGSTLYPTLSRLFHESPQQAEKLLHYTTRFVITLSLPIAAGGIVLAPRIIEFVYGSEYVSAVTSFQILLFSIVTSFISIPYMTTLIARDERKYFVAATAAGAVVNCALNFLLIPMYLHVGAAWATVAAEVVVFCISYYYGSKSVVFSMIKLIPRPLIAAIAMAWFASLLSFHVGIIILLSAMVYVVIVGLIGGFSLSDIKMIRSALSRS